MACPTFRCTVNKVEKIADLAVLNFGAFAERNKKRKNQERRILSRKTLTRFLSYIRIRSIQYKERLILKKKKLVKMMEDTGEDVLRQKPSMVSTFFKRISQVGPIQTQIPVKNRLIHFSFQTYQIWLDRWTPHTTSRWVFTVVLIVLFMLRIVLKQV